MESMNENLSFQDRDDEIGEVELDVYVNNVILEAKASLTHVLLTVNSTSTLTVQEQDPTSHEESEDDKACIDSGAARLTTHSVITSTPDPVPDHDHQEPSVANGKHVDASVNDTVTSKANEHKSDVPSPTEDPTQKPPAKKKHILNSSWFRGRSSSVVKPADKYDIKSCRVAFEDVGPQFITKTNIKSCRVAFEDVGPQFITKTEHLDINGNEVFVLNTSKIPKTKIKKSVKNLCLKAKLFIEKNLTTPKFLLVLHGGDGGNGADLNCLKLGRKFYKLLKNSFAEKLEHCVVYRPGFYLKAVFTICRPFMREDVKHKISVAYTPREFVFHDIPDTILLID